MTESSHNIVQTVNQTTNIKVWTSYHLRDKAFIVFKEIIRQEQ